MGTKSRVFVAGHTGLLGSAMERRLRREAHIQVLTRTRSELDLRESVRVDDFFSEVRPHHVILAAGRVGGIMENKAFPAELMEENIAIQFNVLRAAYATGVRRVVVFGSSCMYPRDCPQPMSEEALLTGKPESTSLAYAVSKIAGTFMCLAYNAQHGGARFLPVIPNSVYGPNDNFNPESGHVLAALIARLHRARIEGVRTVTLWGSGAPRREFVHADDVADACMFLIERDMESTNFPINIGVGCDVSIRELAVAVADVVGYDGRIEWDTSKPDGAPRKLLDSSRLRSLGWEPRISLQAGLQDTYAWYLQSQL